MAQLIYSCSKAILEPLEIDIDKLRDRAATLENVAEAMSRLCYLRRSGFCLLTCQGQIICNLDGLKMLPWQDLPAELVENL